MFSLNSNLKIASLNACFIRKRHVVIDNFVELHAADALSRELRARTDWRRLVLSGDRVAEFTREGWSAIAPERRAELEAAIYATARNNFQFRYEAVRVSDVRLDREKADDLLNKFANFMSEPKVIDILRQITGHPEISFCDAQGTAYAPGDFLTGHDDEVKGKARRAAYVFGLSTEWRPEWGGLLLFHRPGGRVDGVVPDFNRLTLFDVPQVHSVTEVTRSAPRRRYSVTGWLREREDYPAQINQPPNYFRLSRRGAGHTAGSLRRGAKATIWKHLHDLDRETL